jgi:glycosyltransferase involved in cell wall biosynthesis
LYVVERAAESVRLASDNIIVTGFVPMCVPMCTGFRRRSSADGGGTRLKVLEAMSMRRPIVTTSVGCEGIAAVDGENALIADTPSAFAEATIRLLRDHRLRRSLVERGSALVHAQYDWSVVGAQMEEAYTTVCQRRVTSGVRVA